MALNLHSSLPCGTMVKKRRPGSARLRSFVEQRYIVCGVSPGDLNCKSGQDDSTQCDVGVFHVFSPPRRPGFARLGGASGRVVTY